MNFSLRRVHDFADCKLNHDSTTIEFGFLDNKEAKKLLDDFKNAIEELEWFILVTDKENT